MSTQTPPAPLTDALPEDEHKALAKWLAETKWKPGIDLQRYQQSFLPPSAYSGTLYGVVPPHALKDHQKVLTTLYNGPSDDEILRANGPPEAEVVQGFLGFNYVNGTKFLSAEAATVKLEIWNSFRGPFPASREAALDRLRRLKSLESWGPDIIYKAFGDLDLLLFRGVLAGRCSLRWITEDQIMMNESNKSNLIWAFDRHGWITCRDPSTNERKSLAVGNIRLNSTLHFLDLPKGTNSWDEMWDRCCMRWYMFIL